MNRARAGLGFFRFLLSILLVALVVVLGWSVYANWNIDADGDGEGDGFTFRVFDVDWWTASREVAKPYVAKGRDYLAGVKDEIWGEGGLVDEAEGLIGSWRKPPAAPESEAAASGDDQRSQGPTNKAINQQRNDASPGGPTATPGGEPADATAGPVAATDGPSPRTRRLEERIRNAMGHFEEGHALYKQGDPSTHGWTDRTVENLDRSKEHFHHVRRILEDDGTLAEYERMDDHDPRLLADARAMLHLNQKMLYHANKMSGGL